MRTPDAIIITLVLGVVAAAGCAPTAPYVYKQAEFDRRQPTFGREPADISAVVVCYGSRKTSPEQVAAVADAECGKFGRVAIFARQDYQRCPVTTPVAAYYVCENPARSGERPVRDRSPELPPAPGWVLPPAGFIVEPKDTEE